MSGLPAVDETSSGTEVIVTQIFGQQIRFGQQQRTIDGYVVVSCLLKPREKGSVNILVVGGTKALAILVEVGGLELSLQSVLILPYRVDC